MDLRIDDGRIIPLRYRIAPGKLEPLAAGGASWEPADPLAPTDDDRRLLAYSDAERDAITQALKTAGTAYSVTPESQPNPALLASLQGRVRSRSEALSALAAGKPPPSLTDLETRLQALESAKVATR